MQQTKRPTKSKKPNTATLSIKEIKKIIFKFYTPKYHPILNKEIYIIGNNG